MTGFRVDPADLAGYGQTVERSEPFAALAEAARRLTVPEPADATSAAIERFRYRLVAELTDLATATGSLGHATRSAAAGYQEVEDSISRTVRG